jgi:hypothetical protein
LDNCSEKQGKKSVRHGLKRPFLAF